jgi:hypothetical protein
MRTVRESSCADMLLNKKEQRMNNKARIKTVCEVRYFENVRDFDESFYKILGGFVLSSEKHVFAPLEFGPSKL